MERLSQAAVGDSVALPEPRTQGAMSVEEAIGRRRSQRGFAPEPLGVSEIAQLLWSAQGLTSSDGRRAAPSAGACYPLETYLVCAAGLFRYDGRSHAVTKVNASDLRAPLAEAAWGQGFIAAAPISVVFAAVYERTTQRYGDRGARYVHIDVGHAAENVHLQGEAMGIGSCAVGAFDDRAVAGVLDLPEDQSPVYIIPLGRPGRG